MTNPLLQLKEYGQSVWYDDVDRAPFISGQFKKLLDEDGVVGVTANPTIFQKSISHGDAYTDQQITQLIKEGKSTNEIYEALIITDVQTVADILRPIYDRTNHNPKKHNQSQRAERIQPPREQCQDTIGQPGMLDPSPIRHRMGIGIGVRQAPSMGEQVQPSTKMQPKSGSTSG